jgi:fatty acid desaturase
MPNDPLDQPASFAALKAVIVGEGLLARQPSYYSFKFATTGLMLAGALVVLSQGAGLPGWVHLVNAIYLAFVGGQIGLLGHDAGHGQVFRSERWANAVGLVLGNLVEGVSFGWWCRNHGAHHKNPNHADLDPAVNFALLAFTPEQARAKPRRLHWMVRHQAQLIVLLACFELVNLHAESVVYLVQEWRRRPLGCALEAVLLAVHVCVYIALIGLLLGPGLGLAFATIHYVLSGLYLASLFAPNHKGMPIVSGSVATEYLRVQVLTARNVEGGPLIDFWYGGLNRQIEHHLFPSMPRNRLSEAAPVVRAYCAQHGLAYHQTGVVDSYRELFADFQRIGSLLARPDASALVRPAR